MAVEKKDANAIVNDLTTANTASEVASRQAIVEQKTGPIAPFLGKAVDAIDKSATEVYKLGKEGPEQKQEADSTPNTPRPR